MYMYMYMYMYVSIVIIMSAVQASPGFYRGHFGSPSLQNASLLFFYTHKSEHYLFL